MVIIIDNVYKEIIEHAESGYPYEICGLLLGTNGTVKSYKKCNNLNTERSIDRYELDPLSFQEADTWARSTGQEILGVYHSHPDHPSFPSEFDRERAWPDWIYIIISVNNGKFSDLRAWELRDFNSNFDEKDINLESI